MFCISTFNPILFNIESSRAIIFVSFVIFEFCLFFLNNWTKFSACLTDSVFSIILFATNEAFSNPTKIFAWPIVNFCVSISFITSAGRVKILKEFEIKILVLTDFHRRYLDQLGISKDKVFVFPNYVENNKTSIEVEASYLMYAGRVSEEKGLEELISTYLDSELNNIRLKIIGQGPMYKDLKQKYTTVDFLGEVDHSDVLEYIRNSLAVITCTKLYEGQPMLLCEASSLSVPSIYPETGGVSEFFPPDYALSFKQFDYSELLERINMLKNRSFVNDLGATNKDFLSKYLKKDKLISKFAEIING